MQGLKQLTKISINAQEIYHKIDKNLENPEW